MTQYARPDSDVTTTGFTGSYTDVDEVTYSMSDYISADGANNQTDYYFEVGLSDVTDPNVGTGHVIGATWNMSSSQSHTLKIQLYQGTTLIATALNWTGTYNSGSPVGGGINDNNVVSYTLTSTEANNITDYTNLRIRFYLKKNTSLGGRTGRFGWAELAVPDAATNITVNSGNPPGIVIGGNTNTTAQTGNTISAGTTPNVAVAGQNAIIEVGTSSTNTAPSSNIAVNGSTSSVSVTSTIEVSSTTSNININGSTSSITVEVNAIINAEVSDIDIITNHPPTVTTEKYVQIAANETNIQVGGNTKVLELYPSLITSLSPWNYFKGEKKTGTNLYQIFNYGSNPGAPVSGFPNENSSLHIVNGQAGNTDIQGIPGDSTNKSYLVSITPGGSNQFMYITYGIGSSTTGLPQNWLFPNDANVTYEFWMRTADLEADILLADYSNTTLNNQTDYNINVIGIKNGYLASYSYGTASTFASPENVVATSTFVADDNWHHYVFTKSTSGSTVNYKSYVDGIETNIPISIGSFLNGSGNFFGSIGGCALNKVLYNKYYSLYFDEIAMYKTALTTSQIQEHLYAGAGSSAVTVSASVTDIDVDAKDVGLSTVINAEKTNISIMAPGAIIATDNVLVIATSSNVELDGQDFTTSNASNIDVNAQKANIGIEGKRPQLTTVLKDFKFISAQDTALSANDAEEITSLEYGGVLYNQVKKQLFRLGNTSNIPTKFVISIVSNESSLIPAVKLSLDNITYSSSVTIDVVLENNISDIIYVKFDTNILDVLGPGTFLINVEQTNV